MLKLIVCSAATILATIKKIFVYKISHEFCLPYKPLYYLMMWHWTLNLNIPTDPVRIELCKAHEHIGLIDVHLLA